jgi:membrane protease YdiL (CAAX protease family)
LSAPYLALAGALFGWLKWKTGSLYPAMAAHFAHNFIVIHWF